MALPVSDMEMLAVLILDNACPKVVSSDGTNVFVIEVCCAEIKVTARRTWRTEMHNGDALDVYGWDVLHVETIEAE